MKGFPGILSFPSLNMGIEEGNSPLFGVLDSFPKLQLYVGILNDWNLGFQEQSKERTKRNLSDTREYTS